MSRGSKLKVVLNELYFGSVGARSRYAFLRQHLRNVDRQIWNDLTLAQVLFTYSRVKLQKMNRSSYQLCEQHW